MIQITFTNRAVEDLDAINDYRSTYSPAYADHLIDTLIAKIEQLKSFPEMGRKVPEFSLAYLRELVHNDYRIVYKIVSNEQIDVITIQHSSRNMADRFFDR
ncbi:type II toxin-antitoxin system RelE/ParE family toxin [Spirosoma pollinicola]|uniref:Type II toxin-antitoxin system mRNA interferase toxin, RelE/StbE family n=1 Tax=Spirosoma pollinicola TaxID=2057025 RepID=A0A2K8Z4E8_9BACT|nr:type II toxin-antitoxin system RelE/ParE family toxin [Spirosoma pollinicola]AUD04721.1 type II toxin-antitoxin system mRNA interferase toxin, RelE/StbE family [Spirosoma pollinicola]